MSNMRSAGRRPRLYSPRQIKPPTLSLTDLYVTAYGETMGITKAARVLGVSRWTIYRHKDAGHFISAGGSKLQTRSIAAYIESQGQGAPR